MNRNIPHVRIIVAVCIAAMTGYGFFSVYAVAWLGDATMTGDVIGTWKSFAVAAFAFWLGSSSGGKAKDGDPQEVKVTNQADEAIPTTDAAPTNAEQAYEGPDLSEIPEPAEQIPEEPTWR